MSVIETRYRTEMADIFSDENRIRKWAEVELALLKAHAKLGNVPKEAVPAVEKAVKEISLKRVEEIEKETHHDLMAVVKAIAEKSGKYGEYIHLGATSYDIEDTATALIFREAFDLIEKRMLLLGKELKAKALKYKNNVCVGRTHGQHAIPTTIGMKFALYYSDNKRNLERLKELRRRVEVGKIRGAVGNYASFENYGFEKVEELVLKELKLGKADVSNQIIQRDVHASAMFFLAVVASNLEKIAKEIRNLSRTEIAEWFEPFGKKQVGSSTMPQKRNPHKSERICSLARVVRANVQVALENIALEHERDLTNSANERILWPTSFCITDYMLKQMIELMSGLEVDVKRARENVDMTKGGVYAERLMLALSKKIGRQKAHEVVRELTLSGKGKNLQEIFEKSRYGKLIDKKEIERIFKTEYVGKAKEIVEKVCK
ncbi:MAG: adenylosuccinate lyase [Candidatus Anstonellales archaeon]